ncbi:MAG: SusE domain-containing protein [Bacteroidetes bacterium]|nr:SusE domain-containing protein [Bacteroidota bacterium]
MKNIYKSFFFLSLIILSMVSCKKDENKIYFEGGTAPVLTASEAGPLVLLIANKDNPAISFNWTNPEYRFSTGISSQDVTYTLQMDTVGANFTSPLKAEVSISKDLAKNFTVKEFNTAILGMKLEDGVPHDMEIRIKSNLSNGSGVLYSNIITLTVTPYLDVVYPVPANLYITGSATPASWQCGCGEPELLSQKFTKINSSTFEITIALSANNSYLFLPVYGSWAHKYAFPGAGNSNNVNGDRFQPDSGGDFKAPPTSGTYKITVDFKTGKFTVTQ